jgi:8-oxo-dGTP pyrophosphatase MutT (NUDIX family)
MDPVGRIFLQHSRDPGDPAKGTWWELPGGGIERGETSSDAVRRELYEECGFTDVSVGDVLWSQRVQFRFANIDFDQTEDIHLATVPSAEEWEPTHLEALEALAFLGARWWDLAELLDSPEAVVPPDLRDRLRAHLPAATV